VVTMKRCDAERNISEKFLPVNCIFISNKLNLVRFLRIGV